MKKYVRPQISNHRSNHSHLTGLFIIVFFAFSLSFLTMIPNLFLVEKTQAASLTVGPGEAYTTIQSAIDAAVAGDTISIKNGTYTENLSITKALTLNGESNTGTIVTAVSAGNIINVTAADVIINNLNITTARSDSTTGIASSQNYLTVTSSKIHDIINPSASPIGVAGKSYFTVTGNEIFNIINAPKTSSAWGINMAAHTTNVKFTNNNIHDLTGSPNGGGINIANSSSTVTYLYPDWNVVSGNTMNNINGDGIDAYQNFVYSVYMVYEFNSISNTSNGGIRLRRNSDHHNIVRYNHLSNIAGSEALYTGGYLDQAYGNTVKDSTTGYGTRAESANNMVYQNIFANAPVSDSSTASNNVWHNSSLSRGNYYSNANFADANNDGINDNSYAIGGTAGEVDPYPLATSRAFFEDVNANPVTIYNYGDNLALRVRDFSINLNSDVAETIQAIVTDSTSGDSETFTLTETSVGSGIFELKGIQILLSTIPVSDNGKIDVIAGVNNLRLTYTNIYDGGNTSQITATMDVPANPTTITILPQTGTQYPKFLFFYFIFPMIFLASIYHLVYFVKTDS